MVGVLRENASKVPVGVQNTSVSERLALRPCDGQADGPLLSADPDRLPASAPLEHPPLSTLRDLGHLRRKSDLARQPYRYESVLHPHSALRRSLIEYCGRDTEAMVRIYDALR